MRLQNRQGCTIDLKDHFHQGKPILNRTTFPTGSVTETRLTDDEAQTLVADKTTNHAFKIIF